MRNNLAIVGVTEPTEQLVGGPCDGLATLKTDKAIVYAGMFGVRLINVYERREADGKLHYAKSMTARRFNEA